jgi:hypothetical protein
MSESRKFTSWLVRLDPKGYFSLDALVVSFATTVLGKDPLAAEAYAQANRNSRWADVVSLQQDLHLRGVAPLLVDVDMEARTGKYLVPEVAGELVSRSRAIRCASRSRFLRSIDGLTAREYEALACVASSCAGADKVHLTPPGNEGGVDFFALIRNPARCHVFEQSRSPLRVIGQCKMYSSPVSVDKVRQFIQTISSVCNQSALTEQHVPAWFRGASGPVVGWIIGHSGFQSGAVTLARNHGIVLSDSLDIAEICAQSRQFPLVKDSAEYDKLLRQRVAALLN